MPGTELAMKQLRSEATNTRATQAARLGGTAKKAADKGIQPLLLEGSSSHCLRGQNPNPVRSPQEPRALAKVGGTALASASCKLSPRRQRYPHVTSRRKLCRRGSGRLNQRSRSLLIRTGAFSLELLPAAFPGFVGV